MIPLPPLPSQGTGRRALLKWRQQKSILGALETFRNDLGRVFRMPLPGFNPIVLAGAEANRFVLVEAGDRFQWRLEGDPVDRLLRNGLLVLDGAAHDDLRALMTPALDRQRVNGYAETIVRYTDQVTASWGGAQPQDMLIEMRRLALLILVDTLFGVNLTAELPHLWRGVLRTLDYIAPGLWLVWRGVPRPGYRRAREQLDEFLYRLIAARRSAPNGRDDLLGHLIGAGLTDALIRDQLLTMLIAGHDTSTAVLAWSLYLMGKHPEATERARAEVDVVLGQNAPGPAHLFRLEYLDHVIKETLRLYPPIHIGNRLAARDLEFEGFRIPSGTRVLYSIYLSHRDPEYWHEPQRFDPDRFSPEHAHKPPPFAYLPFGGGPRFCLGATFAQVEAKLILARLLQKFDLRLISTSVRPHMGATLEPRPVVAMSTRRRPIEGEKRDTLGRIAPSRQ